MKIKALGPDRTMTNFRHLPAPDPLSCPWTLKGHQMKSLALSPVPILSLRFASAYAVTMRPYLLFVSGITGVAALALARAVDPVRGLAIVAASFLTYGFGQALTDCFQVDTDSISAPYRPLTRGEVRTRDVLVVSLLGLLACVVVFVSMSTDTVAPGLLGVLGLATYTWFKRRWWGGPAYNALIVVILFVMAGTSAEGSIAFLDRPGILAAAGAVFAGYANFVLAGYFKDIAADTATGYRTFPVVFGRRASSVFSDVLAALFLAAVFLAARKVALPAMAVWALAVTLSIVAQVRLHRVRTDREAHGPIGFTVHVYLLGLAAVAVSLRPEWLLPLLGFYGAFVATLVRRPSQAQI
jgi:4-hydroxybenzoate polyprenyltransferase